MKTADLSLGELFVLAVDSARHASANITKLLYSPLAANESTEDRTLRVTLLARQLAEAWDIIDTLADGGALPTEHQGACFCGRCKPTGATTETN